MRGFGLNAEPSRARTSATVTAPADGPASRTRAANGICAVADRRRRTRRSSTPSILLLAGTFASLSIAAAAAQPPETPSSEEPSDSPGDSSSEAPVESPVSSEVPEPRAGAIEGAGLTAARPSPEEEEAAEEEAAEDGDPERGSLLGDPFRRRRLPWPQQAARGFVAMSLDVGFLYIRPRLSVGHGRPHFLWFGADVNPIVSQQAVGAYAGLRAHHPVVDFRIGGRYLMSFNRAYLQPRESYGFQDIAVREENEAKYVSFESELTLQIPGGRPGYFMSETAVTYVVGVPEDLFVVEEQIKIIVDPPWVWRERFGYIFEFGPGKAIRLGLIAELVGVPGRDLVVFRGGALVRVRLFDDLEIRASFIPAIIRRDRLGVNGGDFGLIGIRWRWATGVPKRIR